MNAIKLIDTEVLLYGTQLFCSSLLHFKDNAVPVTV